MRRQQEATSHSECSECKRPDVLMPVCACRLLSTYGAPSCSSLPHSSRWRRGSTDCWGSSYKMVHLLQNKYHRSKRQMAR